MPFFGVPIRNGLPIGLGSVAGFGVQQFDPLELFAGGAEGVWYDPSDTSTLFQDPAGTTPVTAVEQPVGLMLDKSKGLVLGPELVTNGDFNGGLIGTKIDGSGSVSTWTLNSTNPISGAQDGRLVITTGATGRPLILWPVTTVAGKAYLYSFDYKVNSGSPIIRDINDGGALINVNRTLSGSGRFQAVLTATGAANFGALYFNNSLCDVQLDNISVRELPGNHAISYNSTTARPTLSARVNLLTYSEEFDNAAWGKTRTSITANTIVAPDGTLTGDKLVENTDNNTHILLPNSAITLSTGVAYAYSIYAKAAERTICRLGNNDLGGVFFDLSAGTVTSVGSGFSGNIQSVGNGWYRLTAIQASNSNVFGRLVVTLVSTGTTTSYTGDGYSGIYIWGADLRPANIGANIPAYQRIAAATDYDTNGFPKYLYFAGVDDGMSTPANLNLTSTDKVTVFSGVRKLSDAATGMVAELSATADTNNGVFSLLAPSTTGSNSYRFLSKGTILAPAGTGIFAAAPDTSVLTGIGDISGDIATLSRNGAVVETSTADQGTGNYGSYPLYIGSRGSSTFWLNGYLYGLTVVGAQLTTPQIESMENWTGGKTGISVFNQGPSISLDFTDQSYQVWEI